MKLLTKILFICGVGILLSGCSLKGKTSDMEEEPKPKLIETADLPFVKLIPRSDRHRLDIGIYNIKAPRVDYQILYTAVIKGNSVERGAGGRDIKLTGNELVRNGDKAVVFGSESSGKFKYDEGVENGSIEITYRNASGKSTGRAQTDWHLQDSKETNEFTSHDSKFKFVPSGKTKGIYLTMHTLGLPMALDGKVISGPYLISSSESVKQSGAISFKLDGTQNTKLEMYDESSKSWKEIASSQSGNTLTASISSLSVFAVVAK